MKKVLTEIFGRIWALWALIIFLPTLIVCSVLILLSNLIPAPYGMRTFRFITYNWMGFFLYSIGSPLRIYGKHNYQPGTNYVVVSNHRSMMDVPVMTPFFPGINKTIAKKSMARIPFFGWVYMRGSVLVDRKSDASRRKSFDDMKKVLLQENLDMVIYPEGTRNRSRQPLKDFYDGAFRLAMSCEKNIIPVVMLHTATVLPPNKFFFVWPHRLEMHILPPVSYAGHTPDSLKKKVREIMWDFLEKRNLPQ